jgi:hypothetical protein
LKRLATPTAERSECKGYRASGEAGAFKGCLERCTRFSIARIKVECYRDEHFAKVRRVNPKKFFAELKRRHVYKVAIAYAVVAWLLIQVATQVFPFFEIPNWELRLKSDILGDHQLTPRKP